MTVKNLALLNIGLTIGSLCVAFYDGSRSAFVGTLISMFMTGFSTAMWMVDVYTNALRQCYNDLSEDNDSDRD